VRYHLRMLRRSPSDSLGWPVAAAGAAVVFLVVGTMMWSVWGPRYCPAHSGLAPHFTSSSGSLVTSHTHLGCVDIAPQHRMHPLRAEALWAVSALSALIGLFWAAGILVGRRSVARPDGLGRA